ncbi:MAG TPA: hypothetical protein VF187_04100 [Gemmatimonadales bacterium]
MPPFGAALLIGLSLALMRFQSVPHVALWQADLSIRSLTISQANGNLTARVIVSAESGEAIGARVEVLLPVGVGIVTLGKGCVAGPSPTGIRELQARVECTLGTMAEGTRRELKVVTTTPPAGVARGFAVVVMSDTPDPRQGNNFAERVIPLP